MTGRLRRSQALRYVVANKLVGADDLVGWFDEDPLPADGHMLPELFVSIGDGATAERLLALLRTNLARFERDYRWGSFLVESILCSDSSRLFDLAELLLLPGEGMAAGLRAQALVLRARRVGAKVDARLLALFDRSTEPAKALLSQVLLVDPHRAALERVVPFLSNYTPASTWGNATSYVASHAAPRVPFDTTAQVTDFLAAIPAASVSDMLLARSALLGGEVGNWIWSERHVLEPHCAAIVEARVADEVVLVNALRVLVFLASPAAPLLAEQCIGAGGSLTTLANLVPAFLPASANEHRYRQRVLDQARDMNRRAADFSALIWLGVDLSSLLNELIATDPIHASLWEFLFLSACAHHPSRRAIPLLQSALASAAEGDAQHYAPLIVKLAELGGREVAEFLIGCARADAAPWVRLFACVGLQHARRPSALLGLLALAASDPQPQVAEQALVAAVASGPQSIDSFSAVWAARREADPWRHVIAGRLRASSESAHITAVATDPSKPWQCRRAAILAAGRLPYDEALATIAPKVLSEESSFATLDLHHAFAGHELVARLTIQEVPYLLREFQGGRSAFITNVARLLESIWKESVMFPEELPSGHRAAEWLYDRLVHYGGPSGDAAERVSNELHIPILHAGIVRGFRMARRFDQIEALIPNARSQWLVCRAISEWGKRGGVGVHASAHLHMILAASLFASSPFAANCIKSVSEGRYEAQSHPLTPPTENPPVATAMGYEAVVEAIKVGTPLGAGLVVADLTPEHFAQLVQELAPPNDYGRRWTSAPTQMTLTADGFAVAGARSESIDHNSTTRALLRPALAAANRFGLAVRWHDEMLARGDHVGQRYVSEFLGALVRQGDPVRLRDELEMHGSILLPLLGVHGASDVSRIVDHRLIPVLRRFANAGTDALLETLTWTARCIDDPAVDPLLAQLFHRWTRRFRPLDSSPQHLRSIPLWRAFGNLTGHCRFRQIPNYDLQLAELLKINLQWFHKNAIVAALGDSARMYATHEAMLLRAAPFEHFMRDEVDRLDDAADRLFSAADQTDN